MRGYDAHVVVQSRRHLYMDGPTNVDVGSGNRKIDPHAMDHETMLPSWQAR